MFDKETFIHEAPQEVLHFLSRSEKLNSSKEVMINILSIDESFEYSKALRSIKHAEYLGLIALNDAQDSNPYCYISQSVTTGMIIHFSHDPEPRIKFSSLDDFENALNLLKDVGHHIDDMKIPDLQTTF